MKLRLHVQNVSTQPGVPDKAAFSRWARAALEGYGRDEVELGMRIVDEEESAELNRRYRHKKGPTNVLSFPYENPPGVDSHLIGDIVICAPVVQREARDRRRPDAGHWAHMVVHAIMHLRGYDHENEQDADIMRNMETTVLRTLGFPDPYLS